MVTSIAVHYSVLADAMRSAFRANDCNVERLGKIWIVKTVNVFVKIESGGRCFWGYIAKALDAVRLL